MVQTKIELLKIGADDYMTKPFDLYELLARIEANLKRTVDNPYQNNNTLIYKNIKINYSVYPDNSIRIYDCLDNVRITLFVNVLLKI